MTVKCEKCQKEFKTDIALKIHAGRMHGEPKKAKPAPKKKAAKPTKVGKGKFACTVCGRKFKMGMHLARHAAAAHGKAKKARKVGKVGRPAGHRVAAAPVGLDVQALTVDQLLTLKQQVDARLTDIAKRMRAAKVAV
jgi:hypothetical protein